MQRLATVLTALLFALSLSACDSTDFDDDDDDVREAGVRAIELAFDLDDAAVNTGDYDEGIANLGYDMPEISSNVVREGAVLVYINDEADTWRALPFTQGITFPDAANTEIEYTYSLNYAYDVGLLDVFVTASTDAPAIWDEIRGTALFSQERTVKVVIISEFATARAQSAGVNLRSYSEVEQHFGLEK